ncbi:competence type IV pilus minor pilin ComGF [Fructilactobacillus cliffordii]|uniref:Prepilin-type N-terminal cleavage/methylation domain-containing protein n=1 Tax=Fructilactobacillus cliffordii TaxID=2940299 RepID=A0A9Q9E2H3_9LACO|nr:competence type IV pilus minor pilin ComGF [Fructilactobacillus cliffordii]USS86784.1 prepilin-type N-terminal cleavage/methylation domain-containing protein [Fructilactobacillus cliffordii]USS89780.1 prepilin-type N-terminal cleavage/methylation domain-containing protein [Fructilactobacillus cliffordii]
MSNTWTPKWKSSRSGFTLIETIISLGLISVGISLMLITVSLMRSDVKTQSHSLQFYRFVDVLESHHFNFKVDSCNTSSINLTSQMEQQHYYLVLAKQTLKLRTSQGGYMPLLMDVEKTDFKLQRQWLVIRVLMEGKWYEVHARLASG